MALSQQEIDAIYRESTENTAFRDHLSTIDEGGKRIWLYPKKPDGSFHRKRSIVSISLLLFLLIGPFIKINGQPLLLLNVFERKFVILGQVFWPQDFFIFALLFITLIVSIILFTVAYGRIFCGWLCPQTIFMEFAFRKVEYWIEGDYMAQKKLDKSPWTADKVFKKGMKHTLFFLMSVVIMHTFMAYLIGVDKTQAMISTTPFENPVGFISMFVLTLLFYGVFARMREQVCTTICPYGRLQGVLLDQDSTVIAYDYRRGEKRGKLRKNEDRSSESKGDCIDCRQCVLVCPTGIDIRNGTQLECINCTACIDACDQIMDKVGRPKGLIRYASDRGIKENIPFKVTKRMLAYAAVLVVLLGASASKLLLRSTIDITVLRTPGMLYQQREDGRISNLYNVTMINKSNDIATISIVPDNPEIQLEMIGETIAIKPNSDYSGAFFLIGSKAQFASVSNPVKLQVLLDGKILKTVSTKFMAPYTAN